MSEEAWNWILILIALLAFLAIFFLIVGIRIPAQISMGLNYIIKVIWGVIP